MTSYWLAWPRSSGEDRIIRWDGGYYWEYDPKHLQQTLGIRSRTYQGPWIRLPNKAVAIIGEITEAEAVLRMIAP
jgi:hypothetical protein